MFAAAILLAAVLTNAADIVNAALAGRTNTSFVIEGLNLTDKPPLTFTFTLMTPGVPGGLHLLDRTSTSVSNAFAVGDVLRAEGRIGISRHGVFTPACETIKVVGHRPTPPPIDVSIRDAVAGRFDFRPVRVRGVVHETFHDEIDADWTFVVLNGGGDRLTVAFRHNADSRVKFERLTGAEISVVGIPSILVSGQRRMFGRILNPIGTNSLTVLRPPSADPFDVPVLEPPGTVTPPDVPLLGRRRLVGQVVAIRQRNQILLRDDLREVHKITLRDALPPDCGNRIEAAGAPETDLYRLNLTDAVWRLANGPRQPDIDPVRCTISELHVDARGLPQLNSGLYGKTVCTQGTVLDVPTAESPRDIMLLKDGDFMLSVDVGACRTILNAVSVGCRVAVTGTCLIETESWQGHRPLPRTTGVSLVLRTPDDLQILARPPWWTPRRLTIVVGVLLLVLAAILVWNRILQRVIDRKSRQLLKEQVGQIKAALRVDERTHLAVELHDSLSQNLSGVACQIAATKGTLPSGADETARHLATAERMLLSCRTELRRCLWDLRGDALEDPNFSEAIRKTLAPVAVGVETIVRFNVPRARLNDTTAHSVLCIVRELVANAIRHGKARTVRIAGELHDGALSFSVRDDGVGFDPTACAGPAEGHFGLEGVHERVKRLDGTFEITSKPGAGTRAEVTITSALPAESPP